MNRVQVATLPELPEGAMLSVSFEEHEILLVNDGGTVRAMSNRCGHMNAPLCKGKLEDGIVTCPMHGSRFHVTTGKVLSGPVAKKPPGIEGAPPELAAFLAKAGETTAGIRTHDCPVFTVTVEGSNIFVEV